MGKRAVPDVQALLAGRHMHADLKEKGKSSVTSAGGFFLSEATNLKEGPIFCKLHFTNVF